MSVAQKNINYSKNVSAASKELPAPSYLLSSQGVRIATTTDGYLTAASYGSFKFEPAADVFGNSQYGTEYIVASARDDSQDMWDQNERRVRLSELPSGDDWRSLSQDERYNLLHSRWNMLAQRLRPVKAITTSDHSFAVPVLAAFPVKTHLFLVTPPSEGSSLGSWNAFQNQSVVIIRYKADDTSGGDFSADSGVVSYQAFSVNVTPPCEAFGCGNLDALKLE